MTILHSLSAWLRAHTFQTPRWWNTTTWHTQALQPLGRAYSSLVTWRATRPPQFKADIPVICVGNFTVGGSGKTPTVHLVANLLKACGRKPAILLRGYGGTATGPLQVDMMQHTARLVGDEALLHVHVAPTWVARNRAAGAQAIMASGLCDCIIMDDGAQNPQLHKDLTLYVVDGGTGLGNGYAMPAGPLREDVATAMPRVDGIMMIGDDRTGLRDTLLSHMQGTRKPIFTGEIVLAEDITHLQGRALLPFAGIGRPEKFYHTLHDHGLEVVATQNFPDHHPYTGRDIQKLAIQAKAANAQLITTTKDWVRIPAGYRHLVEFLPVRLDVAAIDDLTQFLLTPWH